MTGPLPFVALVAESHLRLSHSPAYHGHLFPVERYFPSQSPSTPTTSSSPFSPPVITLPLITSEINQLSYFYQLRCTALRSNVDSLNVDLPSSDSGKADVALAFALLLHSHQRDTFHSIIEEPLHSRVLSTLASHQPTPPSHTSAPSVDAVASSLIVSIPGISPSVLEQLRGVLGVLAEIDQLRAFCLTSSMQAAAALAQLRPPLSTPSPLLSSPFALSHHLTELNATVQALLDAFLPRTTTSALCPLSSLTIALPISLTSCHHRFELLSLLTAGSTSLSTDLRCPLCAHPIDPHSDQLIADSALLKLIDAPPPLNEAPPHPTLLTADPPPPVPSPALTLSTLSTPTDTNPPVKQEPPTPEHTTPATVVGLGAFSPTAAPAMGASLSGGVHAQGLLVSSSLHAASAAASSDDEVDERGVSCHQCKSNKPKHQLLFCTTKPNGEGRKRRCRKKYCTATQHTKPHP